MTSLDAWMSESRVRVDAELDRLLPDAGEAPTRLHEAMRYAVFAGGKRIRPLLTLLACETQGGDAARALPGSAALEMIHTYSLVHDDLPALDDDDLRRGRPTVHRAWDEALAILVGDALLTLGLTTLASEPDGSPAELRREATTRVGRAIGSRGMIGGQVADLEAEADWPDDPAAALLEIHRRKTGDLIRTAVRLGGLWAEVTPERDRLLSELGDCLGLLFQISDDILDVEGTDESLGKTAGKDAAAHKLTYPGLFGMEDSRARLGATRRQAEGIARELSPEGDRRWLELVDRLARRSS